MIERKALDLILESATYEDVTVGEEMQDNVTTVEEQAVPGEMRDIEAEAAESAHPAEESATPQS